jgi:hypothetical protein
LENTKNDQIVKSRKLRFHIFIPAKAGIQEKEGVLDPGDPVPAKAGSRGDGLEHFLRGCQKWSTLYFLVPSIFRAFVIRFAFGFAMDSPD